MIDTSIVLSCSRRMRALRARGILRLPRASRPLVNHAAVLHAPNELAFQPWPLPPAPPPGSVRVAVSACGICGSDVHYLKHGRIADFVLTSPMVLGHEAGVRRERRELRQPCLSPIGL